MQESILKETRPVLQILVPIFNRSAAAQEAIENVLACNDERLTVWCNSNCYDSALEKYRNLGSRVKYDSFEIDRGLKETYNWYLENIFKKNKKTFI